MKSVIVIFIICIVLVGAYAYYQKDKAYIQLKQLKESGVQISAMIDSRPIIALDKTEKMLYIIRAEGVQAILFTSISRIELRESTKKGNNASEKVGPDYGFIMLNSGQKIRFGDMPIDAFAAKKLLINDTALQDKTIIIENR